MDRLERISTCRSEMCSAWNTITFPIRAHVMTYSLAARYEQAVANICCNTLPLRTVNESESPGVSLPGSSLLAGLMDMNEISCESGALGDVETDKKKVLKEIVRERKAVKTSLLGNNSKDRVKFLQLMSVTSFGTLVSTKISRTPAQR